MHLEELTITNCFGIGQTTINLAPPIVYLLGRNSSGKTAILDAINSITPTRNPQEHARFQNFRPTKKKPELDATFTTTNIPSIDIASAITGPLRRIANETQLRDHKALQQAITELNETYAQLKDDIEKEQAVVLSKFGDKQCQLTAGQDFDKATERRKAMNAIVARILPNGVFQHGGANHQVGAPTASDLDRHAAGQITPPIYYYTEQYNLTDDLPDHITTALVTTPTNNLTNAFTTVLGTKDVQELLTTNDPDEQQALLQTIQARANNLATTISQDAHRLIEFTLTNTTSGLQITLRADSKKSFYRQLSDATKFLIAYHIHAEQHAPGAILLFDEPSRGLHASVEQYLREFLERLSKDNHVIITTHSEHLLDLDHLERIRLMQQDEEERPVVLNNLRPPRDRENYLLALQPVYDAIGLRHSDHTITNKHVIITEGLSDYLYLRALHEMTKTTSAYGITPGRSDSTMLTLVPFLLSQGVSIKLILDDDKLKNHLQDAYGIADGSISLVPATGKTRGIEDLFSTKDYQRLLAATDDNPTLDDLKIGNSAYAKRTNKRLVAQTFRTRIQEYQLDQFDDETRRNITDLLAFCQDTHWYAA